MPITTSLPTISHHRPRNLTARSADSAGVTSPTTTEGATGDDWIPRNGPHTTGPQDPPTTSTAVIPDEDPDANGMATTS